MADWRIRPGDAGDAAAVAAIVNREIREGLAIWRTAERAEADIAAMLDERAARFGVLIGEGADGAALGWASYGPFRAGEGYDGSVEHSVHVAPGAQGRGLGRALLVALLAHARTQGRTAMVGAIDAENAGSIRLHATLGFAETGRMPRIARKFGTWRTLVLMQKGLDAPEP